VRQEKKAIIRAVISTMVITATAITRVIIIITINLPGA